MRDSISGVGAGNGLVNSVSGSLFVNGGTWTLTDSALNSGGNNNGTIVLNSGFLNANFVNNSNGGVANFPGNLTINGGVLHSSSGHLSMATTDNQKLTINGGQMIVDNTSGGNFAGVQLGGGNGATGPGISFVGIQTNGIVSQPNSPNAASFDLGSAGANKTTSYTLSGGSITIGGGQNFQLGADLGGTSTTSLIVTNVGKLYVSGTICGMQVGARQIFQFQGGTLIAMALDLTNLRDSATSSPGSLVNTGGTLSPGDTNMPGKTTINGTYIINPSAAVLAIDIGGATPATAFQDSFSNYDVVVVTSNVTLNGSLAITLNNGFVPATNDTFTVLRAAGITGSFTNLDTSNRISPVGNPTNSFRVKISPTNIVLADYMSLLPIVSVLPPATNAECGGTVVLTANIAGDLPISYQWFDNNTNLISGATNAFLTLTNVHAALAGNYTLVVTNKLGTASALSTVTVDDTTAPMILLNGLNPITNWNYVSFVDPGASAVDACDGSVAVATNGAVNVNVTGVYSIRYTANDSSGNSSTDTRLVYVVALIPPVITSESVLDDGSFRLVFNGPTGQPYRVLATADLFQPVSNWAVVTNGIFSTNSVTFYDAGLINHPVRFYSIMSP